MMRKSIRLAVATLLIAASPAVAQGAAQASATTSKAAQVFADLSDAEVARRVQAVIDEIETRPEFVGLSVAVARGDHVIIDRGVGIADLEWNAPADARTKFRIGSITKQFTAAAIMKLHEQGKVGLDDPISKYLPDFDTEGHTVTIRQLLNQTSGIPNYTAQPGFAKAMQLDFGEQDVLKLISGVPFDFDPGTGWRYSNTNYFLLGMVVEKVSGRGYGDFMQEAFFKPLGLTHTRYGDMRDIIPRRAQGYAYDLSSGTLLNAVAISMNWPGGAGGLISTAGDLVRWQIALTGGRAVSPASFQQMIGSPVQTGDGSNSYGFGLLVSEANGQRRIWHNGGINGFNSVLMWLPDAVLSTAVISNDNAMPSEAVNGRIIAALTSDKPLPPLRTTEDPRAEPALRKAIADVAAGTPNYASMAPQLAELTRAQLPQLQPMLKAWGPVKSVEFLRIDLPEVNVYRVEFASGPPAIFSIMLAPDGKIGLLGFRPANPAAAREN